MGTREKSKTKSQLAAAKGKASARKRTGADAGLRDEAELLQGIINQAQEGIFVLDREGRYLLINPASGDMMGLEHGQWIGKRAGRHLHPEDFETMAANFQKALSGQRVEARARVRAADGSYRLLQVKLSGLSRSGEPHVLGMVTDVTAQQQAEENLLRAARQWRTSFDSIRDAVCLLDAEGKILRCNRAMTELTGRPFREILGRQCHELVHDEALPPQECPVARAQKTLRREEQNIKLDNRWLEVTVDPIVDEQGHMTGAVHILSDITERKRAEDTLRASEEKFSTIFRLSPNAISITRLLDNTFVDVNEKFTELTGYSRSEALGRTWRELGLLRSEAEERKMVDLLEGRGGISNFELEVSDKQGRTITTLMSLLQVVVNNEECVLTIASDISERRSLEEQLLQAQKMEAIGRLAGGVAHDFNNQLMIILNLCELLRPSFDPEDPRRRDLDLIAKAGERSASLTRQLLAFSRRQILSPQVVDLNRVLAGLEKMLGRVIGEDIELVIRPGPGLGCVRVDPGQIEQVVINLAVNARDAMPQGGRLTLETANVDRNDFQGKNIGLPGRWVMISVSDTGQGMAPQTLSRIFDPFFTTKDPGKGTGLGLSMVYGIIKQCEGEIEVESEPGSGATFRIYLPRLEEEGREPEEHMAREGRGGLETVLIVEDDDNVRLTVKKALASHGYTILEADSGEGALKVLEGFGQDIDLILTDVVMPGMSGPDLIERVRERWPGIKVLFMSGYMDDALTHHGAFGDGAFLLPKPVAIEDLLDKVREILDSS